MTASNEKAGRAQDQATLNSYITHSGHILMLARMSYKRAAEAQKYEALSSILLSAIGLESFINEFEHRLQGEIFTHGQPRLADLAYTLGTLEDRRAGIIQKAEAIHYFLTGEKPDWGALPYQDLRILSALRNELVHRKPEAFVYVYDDPEHDYQPHRYVQYLVSRGVIEVPNPKNPPQWSAYVVCPETARWAYNTVIEIISDFVARLPEGSFAEVSRFLSKELRTLP